MIFTWHVGLGGSLGVWPGGHDYDCRPSALLPPRPPFVCRNAWVQVGGRVPLGIDVVLRHVPVELYMEFVPGVFAYPTVEFLAQGGFGFRWYW